MISNITIKNFKSVVNVNLPLGRFNLLIGANGCGKSNILEGIAMGAAASSDKLDYEYFANRGIRVVEPRFMFPAFDGFDPKAITIMVNNQSDVCLSLNIFYNDNRKPAQWETDSVNINWFIKYLKDKLFEDKSKSHEILDLINKIEESKNHISNDLRLKRPENNQSEIMPVDPDLTHFLIYSLEESKLRKADNSNRTYPLGRHGEGLFAYLKELAQRPESNQMFEEIKENL